MTAMTDPHDICRCSHERQEHNEGGCGVLVGSWSDGMCGCREFAKRDGFDLMSKETLALISRDLLAKVQRQQAALLTLQHWDMLTLDAEGHGVTTADAPWARALIEAALSTTTSESSDG